MKRKAWSHVKKKKGFVPYWQEPNLFAPIAEPAPKVERETKALKKYRKNHD